MQSEFNYQKFKENIISATKKAFLEIMEQYKDSVVYAFSLTCDSAITSIGVIANTEEALENSIEDEEDKYYYKFCEQEWEIWDAGDNEFQEIRSTLVEFRENNKDKISDSETNVYREFFEEYREKIFDICVEVLLEMKKEHFFEENCNNSIFVNFMVPEYMDEDYSIEVFTKLNSGLIVKEYKEHIKDFI